MATKRRMRPRRWRGILRFRKIPTVERKEIRKDMTGCLYSFSAGPTAGITITNTLIHKINRLEHNPVAWPNVWRIFFKELERRAFVPTKVERMELFYDICGNYRLGAGRQPAAPRLRRYGLKDRTLARSAVKEQLRYAFAGQIKSEKATGPVLDKIKGFKKGDWIRVWKIFFDGLERSPTELGQGERMGLFYGICSKYRRMPRRSRH